MIAEPKNSLEERLNQVRQRIQDAVIANGRQPGSVRLLAVSKTRHADEIRTAHLLGLEAFGESYLKEALKKIEQLSDLTLEWHFIGRLQANKTKPIAENFDWVHSLASLKHAQRLNDQRPKGLTPLKACIQINTSGEASKDGHLATELPELLKHYAAFPNLAIQGLMTIPAPSDNPLSLRRPFQMLRELRDRLSTDTLPLATLSMGMSNDLEAAIAEGSSLVRIGTAIFGPRQYNVKN